MLGLDARAARYTWTVAVVLLMLMLVYVIRKTLFFFIVALLFGYLLSPLVNLLDRILPTRTRTPALALAYVILLGILVGGGVLIGSRAVQQARAFRQQLPALLARLEEPSPAVPSEVNSVKAAALDKIKEVVSERSDDILSSLPSAGWKFLSVAGDLIYVLIVPILGFFFLKDGRAMRESLLSLVDAGPRRAMLDDLLADVHLLLAHYMRAILLLSLSTMICYSIVLSILGIPYGILLGVGAGMLEFIPLIGPLTAAAAILLLGGFSGASLLALLIFLGIYRLFQDYVLSPYVMGSGVELHPLVILFGVFAGGELAGIPGTFLSVPVLALLRVLYRWLIRFRTLRLSPKTV